MKKEDVKQKENKQEIKHKLNAGSFENTETLPLFMYCHWNHIKHLRRQASEQAGMRQGRGEFDWLNPLRRRKQN